MNGGLPPSPVPAAERPAAPPFAEAAGQVMARQVVSALRGKRFLAAVLLASLAPLLALLLRDPDPVSIVRVVVQVILLFLLPLVGVSLGSGLLYDEAEEGTLTYLFTAPVSRSAIVLGKWAAALGLGWGLLLAALSASFALTSVDLDAEKVRPFVRASYFAVLLGYPAYLGVFTFLGTLFRRGFLAGLVYSFGYELVLTFVPGAAKRLAVGFFARSLVFRVTPDETPFEGMFDDMGPEPAGRCLLVLLAVAVIPVVLTLLVVPRKEFRARNVQG